MPAHTHTHIDSYDRRTDLATPGSAQTGAELRLSMCSSAEGIAYAHTQQLCQTH